MPRIVFGVSEVVLKAAEPQLLNAREGQPSSIETMLDKLTHFDFAPLVTERFRLDEGVVSLELELVGAEAVSSSSPRDSKRTPFSLTFRGPREPLLRQRLYPLHHPALGKLELYLIPIGLDASGQRYQAIFD